MAGTALNGNQTLSGLSSQIEYNEIYMELEDDKKFDLKTSFNEIILDEDILIPFVTGYISFRDEKKLFSQLVLTGDEVIILDFNDFSTGTNWNFKFLVTSSKVAGDTRGGNSQVVQLGLADYDYKNFYKEISTSFKNTTIGQFVKKMSYKILGKTLTRFVDTADNLSLAFPYTRFTDMLKYVNQYAKTVAKKHMYIFWTDLTSANYLPFDSLLDNEGKTLHNFYEESQAFAQGDPRVFTSYTPSRQNGNMINVYDNAGNGGTLFTFDSSSKSAVVRKIKYSDVFKKQQGTSEYLIFDEDINNSEVKHYYGSSENIRFENNIISTILNNSNVFSIETDGRFAIRPGHLANVYFKDHIDPSSKKDPIWSGVFLIKSIEHGFAPGVYKQHITFLSNGKGSKENENSIKFDNYSKLKG